jgi:hypothetical protein
MSIGTRIAVSGFGQFMAGAPGRLIRSLGGAALIGWGISMDSSGGTVLAVVGVLPMMSGVLNICPVTGILGGLWTSSSVKACAIERDSK